MGFFSRQRKDGEGEFAGSKHTDSFLPRFRNGDRGIGRSDHRLTALAFSFQDSLISVPSTKGAKGSCLRCMTREYWSTEMHDSGPSF
ncbi:hypothetical protein BHE74_00004142 [Ensete ventricosum]|nr:hypothetical protein BHE74_00004142 [Ensete ventricosum]RZR81651.1 hypothetical protein BHM03_00007913 [Ensete ventricosum]